VVWSLSQAEVEFSLRSQRFSVQVPEQGDVWTALRFLALAEPIMTGAAGPDAPFDPETVHVVFSVNLAEFEAAGWNTLSAHMVSEAQERL
jgi:hypothetical protein